MKKTVFLQIDFPLTCVIALIALATASAAFAQRGPVNGMRPADLRAHAIVDATVVPRPGERIENATIIIRDGVIEAVGSDLDVPPDARIWSGEGLTVYPGLIDAAVLIRPEDRPNSAGAHWNSRIHPEIEMAERPPPSAAVRKQFRELGFTVGAVYPNDGLFRGTGTVIALAEEDEHILSYRERADMTAGFSYGGRWRQAGYPGSLMGAIALMRQTLLDAQWHEQSRHVYSEFPEGNEPPMRSDALVALADAANGRQRVFFDASDEHNALRAARIASEFDLDMMLLGSGMEFRRLDEIAALNVPIVVPMNYPDRPSVNTLATADRTTLREMMTWEQAPTNARRLVDAGVTVALTTHRLDRRRTFHAAVRNAIRHGLSEDDALAALTTVPAQLLGIDRIAGTIDAGKAANLVVVKGDLFDSDAEIRDTWINGRRHEITAVPDVTFIGKGILRTERRHQFDVEFNTVRSRLSITHNDETTRARNVTVQRDQLSFIIDGVPFGTTGFVRFSGVLTGETVTGSGVMPDGSVFNFTIEATELRSPDDEDNARPERRDPDEVNGPDTDDPVTGEWRISANIAGMEEPIPVVLTLTRHDDGSITGVSSTMGMDIPVRDATFDAQNGELRYQIDSPAGRMSLVARIDGDSINGSFTGEGVSSEFSGTRAGARRAGRGRNNDSDDDDFEMPPDELNLPLGAFGLTEPPPQKSILVHGATIWTAGPDGVIKDGWMHVRDGKIAGIGSGGAPRIMVDEVIDATGKHITPGLIDCHSHTGITGGVNEWTHANTAEVRIRDVINPDDVNWYRQLAGGLTVASQLHGSANPIGGQNSVIKLKWGGTADEMLIDDAIEGIKFALGENVVRTQTRYPNTRMGVETLITDAFTAAREYREEWQGYENLPRAEQRRTMPPRRDLQLEALAEIIEGDRLVHCHSYRQDEILMLIRVAEQFGFTIGTFQHVLEGYKVAEAIAEHGAGASAFSDWWGFKVEVMDAIPYAGTLMHEVGVNVSFNSDSAELARRMNIEAAKAVRFGGLDPHEALKFVTINPAWQLRIDHRTGSLEVGKDADFVIWSDDPMSTYSRVEQTWIEGAKYFDLERDREMRENVERERQRLIQKILADAHGAPKDQEVEQDEGDDAGEAEPPSRLMARLIENRRRMMEKEFRMGRDPEELRPGDCGCNDFWFDLMYFGVRD